MAINFNTHQSHPLIEREQTYFLEKSYITIHSEDRDIYKWKDSNNFEIRLPGELNNVINLRLSDINIPNNIYTFTEGRQNTKFRFTVIPQLNTTDADSSLEFHALQNYLQRLEILVLLVLIIMKQQLMRDNIHKNN